MLRPDLASFRIDARNALRTIFTEGAETHDAAGYTRGLATRFADAGFFRLLVPRAFGGLGYDLRHSLVLIEEMMHVATPGLGSSLLLQTNTLCPLLARYGSDDVRRRFLGPMMEGAMIGSLGVTEPTGGSELVHAVRCTARDCGDHWLLSGEKMFITNAPVADAIFVLARTSERLGAFSFGLFAVPAATPGFEVVERLRTLGLKASPVGSVRFDECVVPKSNVVGRIGKGMVQVFDIMREERLMVASAAMFLARFCLTRLRDALCRRGGPGLDRSVLRELSRHHVEMEAAGAFIRQVAAAIAAGNTSLAETSIAKFRIVEQAQRAIRRCLELIDEVDPAQRGWFERSYRDSRVWSVYAGTSETVRDIVGRQIAPEAARRTAA